MSTERESVLYVSQSQHWPPELHKRLIGVSLDVFSHHLNATSASYQTNPNLYSSFLTDHRGDHHSRGQPDNNNNNNDTYIAQIRKVQQMR